jgi:folate-binding protein YgfZ
MIALMAEMTSPEHDPWRQFLAQHGAQFSASDPDEVTGFSRPMADAASWIAPLTDLGLIAAAGADAAHFLHNQLTNDVENLGPGEARLAGYCSPKGRLLASLLIWKNADAIVLQLPRALLPAIRKRLQMFVLRSKVTLSDLSTDKVVLGLSGPAVGAALEPWFPLLPDAPYGKTENAAGTLLRLPDALGARYQWIAPLAVAKSAWPALAEMLEPLGAAVWRLSEIEAGMPRITPATQEQFVPQMINFEAIGGVNFKKGCYPGQEIVARSQYLGKLKRRMLPATVDTEEVQAGAEVFSSSDLEQPCGMVVNAESRVPGQAECLVEIKTAVLEQGTVHLGAASGPVLRFKPLPYSLPDSEK